MDDKAEAEQIIAVNNNYHSFSDPRSFVSRRADKYH